MAYLKLDLQPDGHEKSIALEQVAINQNRLKRWAKDAPMNFQHQFDLVEAECHRCFGRNVEAMEFYDRAIAGAKKHDYIKDHRVSFNLHHGLDSTLLILKHRLKANEKHPEIEVIKEYGDLPEVQCFSGQLNQVFMNLISNAIDALEEYNQGRTFEEIKAHPNCITIQTKATSEQVTIRIRDNGMGMPETVKQRIFEQGFTTKDVGKGTGLGLAIARQIVVEKHCGTLEVRSIWGEGTEFAIALRNN